MERQADRRKEQEADKNTKEKKLQSFTLTTTSEEFMEGKEKT